VFLGAKFGGGFRFRAGQEDLEELAAQEEESPHDSSLQKILQLPKKLLNKENKEHSLSDSEDTSESSKQSEWWKVCGLDSSTDMSYIQN